MQDRQDATSPRLAELIGALSLATDIGAGLAFEHFGIYLAKALSVPNEEVNLFVRVRHRF